MSRFVSFLKGLPASRIAIAVFIAVGIIAAVTTFASSGNANKGSAHVQVTEASPGQPAKPMKNVRFSYRCQTKNPAQARTGQSATNANGSATVYNLTSAKKSDVRRCTFTVSVPTGYRLRAGNQPVVTFELAPAKRREIRWQFEPTAPPQARPNILLVLTDDQTYESLSKMPYVNGRTDWVRFNNAFSNSPICCPSRATILSGQYPYHTGVETNKQGWKFNDQSTVGTWLTTAGYRTALFGKYLNAYPWDQDWIPEAGRKPYNYVPPGWTDWVAYSHDTKYFDFTVNNNGQILSPDGHANDYFAKEAIEFIKQPSDRPFFVTLNFFSPHVYSEWPKRHSTAFENDPVPRSPNFNEADVSDKPKWIQDLPKLDNKQAAEADTGRKRMWRSLLSVDEAVKKLDETLAASGKLDNTIVIFTTDNGYAWGDHRIRKPAKDSSRPLGNKMCVYETCIREPFLVRMPGKPGGAVDELVSTVDIAPTIAQLAGATPTLKTDGVSIVPLLNGQKSGWRNDLLLEFHETPGNDDPGEEETTPSYSPRGFWGIRTARYKYVELVTGERELYDLQTDPFELQNLAGDQGYDQLEADLAARLAKLRAP